MIVRGGISVTKAYVVLNKIKPVISSIKAFVAAGIKGQKVGKAIMYVFEGKNILLLDAGVITIKNEISSCETVIASLGKRRVNVNGTIVEKEVTVGKNQAGEVGVFVSGTFVAKTGLELKAFLATIKNKPVGKTYNGKFYKSVSKYAETNYGARPNIISEHSIEEAWGRYDLKGESGMYYSETFSGNKVEMETYGNWSSYSTYEYDNVQVSNMLDMTDEVVQQNLGTEFNQMVKTISNTGNEAVDKAINYEFTNIIGTWARQNGYKGIIVPGARGNKDYVNLVMFNQSDLTVVLNGKVPVKLK